MPSVLRLAQSSLPFFIGTLAFGAVAHAEPEQEIAPPNEFVVPPERRGGFTGGLIFAPLGSGTFSGYPNKIQEIGVSEYRQELKAPAYSSLSLVLGSAMRDWLSWAFVYRIDAAQKNDLVLSGGMLGLHIESYPAYALGGEWRNIGIVTEFGAGFAQIYDEDQKSIANGGSMTSLSLGAFWEAWQVWNFSLGPGLMYSFQNSDSMKFNSVALNLRALYYGTQH